MPRLTIGLPVYNGEQYVAESLEALLGQTFGDFELIISDNASTDATEEICRSYLRQDGRVQYFRQAMNMGLSPNHNFVLARAAGELFKWASHDDLYAQNLLQCCVDALDRDPTVVLAHSWTAMIDASAKVISASKYPLKTSSPRAPDRFRSLLFDSGGDDDGGVVRTSVLRQTALKESYHHADRTIIAELSLYGPFYQVPDWLYFRRDHPTRAERAHPTVRQRATNMDPRRADRLRHPIARLYVEYVLAYVRAVKRSPLPAAERRECYRHIAHWVATRPRARNAAQEPLETPHSAEELEASIESVVISE